LQLQRPGREHGDGQAVRADDAGGEPGQPDRGERGGDDHGDLQGPIPADLRAERDWRRLHGDGGDGRGQRQDGGATALQRLVRQRQQRDLQVQPPGGEHGDGQAVRADDAGGEPGEPDRGEWGGDDHGDLQGPVPADLRAERDWRRLHGDGGDGRGQRQDGGATALQRLVRQRQQRDLQLQRPGSEHGDGQAVRADHAGGEPGEPDRGEWGGDDHGDLQGPIPADFRAERDWRRLHGDGGDGRGQRQDGGGTALQRLVRQRQQRRKGV